MLEHQQWSLSATSGTLTVSAGATQLQRDVRQYSGMRVWIDQHREGRGSGSYISLKQVAPGLKTGYNDAIHARR